MLEVLMVAEPFGYGPAATLLKCRRQLADLPLRWRYLGPAYTRPLIDPGDFEDCHYPELMESFDTPDIQQALRWADVLFSGTEFRIVEQAARLEKRLVIFDPLFWFWPEVPPVFLPGMTYICQHFPGVAERVARLPADKRGCFVVTPPVGPLPRGDTVSVACHDVVVNFCGMYNPVLRMESYLRYLLKCLIQALEETTCKSVLVAGNLPDSVAHWAERQDHRIRVATLPHARMMQHLAGAGRVLTCPGLNSALEGMALGVPVLFLPPVNNSQAAQLEIFQRMGLVPEPIDWSTLSGLGRDWDDPDPGRAFEGIARSLATCQESQESTRQLVAILNRSLTLDPRALNDLSARQSRFCKSLEGAEFPSLEQVWTSHVVPR